jgi:hypothetical protein
VDVAVIKHTERREMKMFLYLRASTDASLVARPCRVERLAIFGVDGVLINVMM